MRYSFGIAWLEILQKKIAIKEIGRDFTETSAVDGKDKKIKIDTCC